MCEIKVNGCIFVTYHHNFIHIMNFLTKQIHPATLGLTRIIVGVFVLFNFIDFHHYFKESLIHSSFYFTYDYFDWIGMLYEENIEPFFGIAYTFTVFLIFGVLYRISAIIVFLCYSYILLVDIGHYNNHFYLTAILLLFLCVVNGNYWGGLFSKSHREKTISNWQIVIFQGQLFLVYFFGAIAKLDSDWLQGYPMRYWLFNKSQQAPHFLSEFLRSEFAVYFFSWSGLIFDFVIGFALLSKKWRRIALIPLLFFHITNHFLWQIGQFPWLMIGLTAVYFSSDWPKRIWLKLKTGVLKSIIDFIRFLKPSTLWFWFFPKSYDSSLIKTQYKPLNGFVYSFLLVWTCIQLFLPLRHFLFEGHTSWTGQGQQFAWRMMLTEEVSAIRVTFETPDTHESLNVDLSQYLNPSQLFRVGKSPCELLKFIHFLAEELHTKGKIKHPIVHLEVWKSVNEREPKLLNDTTLNYANVYQAPLKSANWILPWSPKDSKPIFNHEKSSAWDNFTSNNEHKFIDDFN